MASRPALLALLFSAGAAVTIVNFIVYIGLGRALRIPLAEASLGFGPRLLHTSCFGVPFTLRLVPLSCFVRPWAPEAYAAARGWPIEPEPLGAGLPLSSRGCLVRVVFAILPLLVTAIAAALAHRAALPSLLAHDGMVLVRGALSPLVAGRASLTAAASLGATRGVWALAVRLLPVLAIAQLTSVTNLGSLAPEPASRGLMGVTAVVMLLSLLLLMAWGVAMAGWVFS